MSTAPALLSTVYASAAAVPFTEDDLAVLLARSRRSNRRSEVTGLLVHAAGHFLQLLEGPEGAVRTLLARIVADPRHTGLRVLVEERIPERRFADWAMGFRAGRSLEGVAGFDGSLLSEAVRGLDRAAGPRAAALLDRLRRR